MKQYTLEQINKIFRDRHLLTRERFFHYFAISYKLDDWQISKYWEIYEKFPYWDKSYAEEMDKILELLEKFLDRIRDGVTIPYRYPEPTRIRKQIVYSGSSAAPAAESSSAESGIIVEQKILNVDFNSATDIFLYAELLGSGIKIIAILDFVEKIRLTANNELDVYEGDILVTLDESYSNSYEDNIYVCTGKGGEYRRLLYTKGRGYIRNGKPDYDGRYNHHVLTCCKTVKRVGNIHIDTSFLTDPKFQTI
jgi:hypothetical protein